MKFNRILQRGRASPLHSSGFVQRKSVVGATNPESFGERQAKEKSRQAIRSYKDAQIVRQYRQDSQGSRATSRREMFMSDQVNDERSSEVGHRGNGTQSSSDSSSRIDIVKPTPNQQNSGPQSPNRPFTAPPPTHSFREPPSRYRS